MSLITENLATHQPDSGNWEPIRNTRLMILVGVTGVGKTTTTNALKAAAAGHSFSLLPNRRTLTDQLIIAQLQQADGEAVTAVADRAKRFAYTRRYRELNPGGMAHALAQLWVKKNEADPSANRWLIFDGLRGANEVEHAANLLPQAKFLVLDAPHFVRVKRLLGRGDAFDTITTSSKGNTNNLLTDTGDLFTAEQKEQLISLVSQGELTADELQSKVQIVLKERQNYDPTAAIATLNKEAPQRTFVADTVTYQPEAIASQTIEKLLS